MEISEKFQKRIIANHGSPIGWSRDQGCQVITWPALWKLGQGAAQKMWHISDTDGDIWKIPKVTNSKSRVADQMVTWLGISGDHVTCFLETRSRCSTKSAVSQSPMEISEKFQKWLIANHGSPIGWSRDQTSPVITWHTLWKLGQGAAQKCGVSRTQMEISEKFQKRIIANQGSPNGRSRDKESQVITWPALWKLGQGAAQKCGISSDTDGDIWKIPKATNSKSGVADQMVTWPRISGDHVTCFLETRSRCSTKSAVSQSPMEISEKFQKWLIANHGSLIGWSRDQWSRVVTWHTL